MLPEPATGGISPDRRRDRDGEQVRQAGWSIPAARNTHCYRCLFAALRMIVSWRTAHRPAAPCGGPAGAARIPDPSPEEPMPQRPARSRPRCPSAVASWASQAPDRHRRVVAAVVCAGWANKSAAGLTNAPMSQQKRGGTRQRLPHRGADGRSLAAGLHEPDRGSRSAAESPAQPRLPPNRGMRPPCCCWLSFCCHYCW